MIGRGWSLLVWSSHTRPRRMEGNTHDHSFCSARTRKQRRLIIRVCLGLRDPPIYGIVVSTPHQLIAGPSSG